MPSLHPSRPASFLGIMVDRDSAVNTVANVWHPEWPSERIADLLGGPLWHATRKVKSAWVRIRV